MEAMWEDVGVVVAVAVAAAAEVQRRCRPIIDARRG